ncbi:MAG: hypothetical protein Tsb0020_48260 [Haliangiales bacterium]
MKRALAPDAAQTAATRSSPAPSRVVTSPTVSRSHTYDSTVYWLRRLRLALAGKRFEVTQAG